MHQSTWESVRNYLLSRKQSQKAQFDKAHGASELQELGLEQEVLFRSASDIEYIPGTVVDKATELCSYIVEAQGKHYCRTREHLRPIHTNLFSPATHKPQPPKPKVLPTGIPKPNLHLKHTPHHKSQVLLLPYVPPAAFPGPCSPLNSPLPLMLPQLLTNYFDIIHH